MIDSGLSQTRRDQTVSHKKDLAIASGLLAGGFLFLRFGWDNNAALAGWVWYQGAALLCGIGLAGIFPEAWLSAAIVLALAPTLTASVEVYLHIDPSDMWPIGLALILFFSFPTPFIGGCIGRLLSRTRLPRKAYFVALLSTLVIGALLPTIQNAQRQRLETKEVPGLIEQIYDAEMVYKSLQPDGNFACDGTLLPGTVGKLEWVHIGDSTTKKYLVIQNYTMSVDCPNEISPHSFAVRAFSHDAGVPAARYTMDETGKLVVEPVR
jgi:hypothetical protein